MNMVGLPSLITFGALAPLPEADGLKQLRRRYIKTLVGDTIQNLGSTWERLRARDASLEVLGGKGVVSALAQWMVAPGDASSELDRVSKQNMVTMPMTVLSHVSQYLAYIEQSNGHINHASILASVTAGGGIQGLCAGLLSAAVVASGRNEDEIMEHAATAIRLAFCIGAYVDLDQIHVSTTSSLAVRWRMPATLDTVRDLLVDHPGTYLAVIRDVRDATITTPTSQVPALLAHLSQNSVTALDAGIPGRYHTPIHEHVLANVIEACSSSNNNNNHNDRFVLPNRRLVRSNTDGRIFEGEDITKLLLESILAECADWHSTISKAVSLLDPSSAILSIGNPDAVPRSIPRSFHVHRVDTPIPLVEQPTSHPEAYTYPDHAIAIVGMACKFPGADTPDEFWDLLVHGKSMLSQMPKDRFSIDDLSRSPPNLQFWGNFLEHADQFDHRFFKKSARESASMDPQQRLLLQVTYEALEASGYFADTSRPRDIGCYVGACATDYDANVGSHPPTAYATVGTLRAFMSGKISHYFGWSGPSLTFDTACSSSAVAIHTACTALQMGECSQAVAGGVALFTSPYLYENLAAAHFLSPTGACKPFDAAADGYCRGEGVGLVVLKRLSDARSNNDHILGVIAGSAVNQNNNSVPITVPHSISQADLYTRVVKQAGLQPLDINFVEAHGTGTPVGDPIEMESLRKVFGSPSRKTTLSVSSVKGNIGHLEGASGVAGLIKAILQIQHRTACVQGSFSRLNPKIPALESDHMEVPTASRELPEGLLSACINNYGAAGSNAALVLVEGPRYSEKTKSSIDLVSDLQSPAYPVCISAASVTSLIAYARTLDTFCTYALGSRKLESNDKVLASLAFSLSRQHNQDLTNTLLIKAGSIHQLQAQLRIQTLESNTIFQKPKASPVVLCFGGQVSESVALDKSLWQNSSLMRFHIDLCDETLRSMDYPSLYPGIFQTERVENVVLLHSMVFSLQYACAQSWIDSGLRIDGLVGHSLGQLTALCVSGVLSLRDALRFVAGRAALMQDHWGSESGAMIAIENDLRSINDELNTLTTKEEDISFEVACHNGPTSYVIVGDGKSIDQVQKNLVDRGTKHKRLNVTYGFHSRFTDPLIPHLEQLASTLAFNEPKIHIETCTSGSSWSRATAQLLAAHTRDPVFFGEAVQRLHNKLGNCTWLEAGSDSSIAAMVRRALPRTLNTLNTFIPVVLNRQSSWDRLIDTTFDLWKNGHQVLFWNFNRKQSSDYGVVRLPPYQFEKNKHWLDLKPVKQAECNCKTQAAPAKIFLDIPEPPVLLRHINKDQHNHLFEVDPGSEEFQALVQGYVVHGRSFCPPMMHIELAARAMRMIDGRSGSLVSIENMQLGSPLDPDTTHKIWLRLQKQDQFWSFDATSGTTPTDTQNKTWHATGLASLKAPSRTVDEEFSRFERMSNRERRTNEILNNPHSDSVKGRMVYKTLSQLATYPEYYRGVESIAAQADQVVGTVLPPTSVPESIRRATTKPWLLDGFLQLAQFHANFIWASTDSETYALVEIDRIQLGRKQDPFDNDNTWNVFAFVSKGSSGLLYDILIYNATTDVLEIGILGCRFAQVHNGKHEQQPVRIDNVPIKPSARLENEFTRAQTPASVPNSVHKDSVVLVSDTAKDTKAAIYDELCVLLAKIAEIPRSDIKGNATFDDIGVDSLMMIEVINEISILFRIDLPIDDLEKLTDFDSLVQYLYGRGCMRDVSIADISDSESSTQSHSIASTSTGVTTVTTPSETPPPTTIAATLSELVISHLEMESELVMESNLADCGLDSLICIELASDIKTHFSVDVDMEQLNMESTFADLVRLVAPDDLTLVAPKDLKQLTPIDDKVGQSEGPPYDSSEQETSLLTVQQSFEDIRFSFDQLAEQTKFQGFWKNVYPEQAELVLSYILEAFRNLGCDLHKLTEGQQLPSISTLPKHNHLLTRLHEILADGGFIKFKSEGKYVKTSKLVDLDGSAEHLQQMLQRHPLHTSETRLLHVTASRLSDCMTGKVDPLQLLFANKSNREILADVYDNAPMCQATTRLLADFLVKAFSASPGGKFRLLEVGAGTGGTARYLVDYLCKHGIDFEYTFTDISGALVNAAKKKFSGVKEMKFMTLDCDRAPDLDLHNKYHVIIATNCIHATTNATASAANLAPMLRSDGVFCLVEFTKGLYWFDLVYGLLDGWWLFSDGRKHALADEQFWNRSLSAAGYKHVSWTDGPTTEAQTMRLICAFKQEAQKSSFKPAQKTLQKRAGIPTETFVFKSIDGLDLLADVYYPKQDDEVGKKRPIGKMCTLFDSVSY